MVQNLAATQKLVDRVGELNENLRMVRLSSDILPAYTEPSWSYFWRKPDVVSYLERNFSLIGHSARASNTRLSMHPGQFVVLASINEGIVQRSIEEFEYHADMARYMGFGRTFQDFKINVHISGKQGPEGIRRAYNLLSPEARNCITIENEENSWGLDDCLTISDIVPIVLDIHHHWIREGEYIDSNDHRVMRVVDSWRGLRPTCHYSVSREDYLVGHDTGIIPDHTALLESGYKKQKLRAHSDFYWNTATNEWALSFLNTHDIMCESKGKNLASLALYEQAKALTLL
jgi:UV DNA damage repair endonuclease